MFQAASVLWATCGGEQRHKPVSGSLTGRLRVAKVKVSR